MISVHSHRPYDYRRLCDICGDLKNRSQLTKRRGQMICSDHAGEQLKEDLAEKNARARPFRTLPVPNAKPQDREGPQTFEADEGAVLNFISQQVAAQARYQDVTNGDGAPVSNVVSLPSFMGWAARYCYSIVADGRRPTRIITLAKSVIEACATYLRSVQIGFGLLPSLTRSNDFRFGGIRPTGANLFTEDTYVGGFAFLHAYQITGSNDYLASARGAANYLRNVQAIGSHAASGFTSLDVTGLLRLDTGSLLSQTAGTASSGDHKFYPSALVALSFWKLLQDVDGDQQVGCTSTGSGAFTSSPSQLLSECISDIRAFWTTGADDVVVGSTITGLSATTPREFYYAYPSGSGAWEFQDGDANDGTMVSAQNFAQALHALYAYEGASTQVTAVEDWFRSFTTNSEFVTTDNSPRGLARASTGNYDPTVTLSTLLLVRDSDNSYAAIKRNGTAFYDWGAFGLLSAMRAVRHPAAFKTSRLIPLSPRRRFNDGIDTDTYNYDRISLRGRSGLTYQTAHVETIAGTNRRVNDGVAAAQFGLSFRQAPIVFGVGQ